MLAMYLFQSSGVINGMNSATTPSQPPIPLLDQPWLLLASIAMCAMSFFLLHQSATFLKWVTSKDESAPDPWAGVAFAGVLSLAMVIFSCFYWLFHNPPIYMNYRGPEDESVPWLFLWILSNRPSELAAGPLLASFFPAVMAAYKFLMAGFIMRGPGSEAPKLSRSPTAALAGAIFSFISLAGSIATLITFFSKIQKP